jgi:hypothetical protein
MLTNVLQNHVINSGHMGSIVCSTSILTQLDFTHMGQLIILVFGASTSGISIVKFYCGKITWCWNKHKYIPLLLIGFKIAIWIGGYSWSYKELLQGPVRKWSCVCCQPADTHSGGMLDRFFFSFSFCCGNFYTRTVLNEQIINNIECKHFKTGILSISSREWGRSMDMQGPWQLLKLNFFVLMMNLRWQQHVCT